MFQKIRHLSQRIYHGEIGVQNKPPRQRPPMISPRKLIRKSPLRTLAPKIEAFRQQIGNLLLANPDWSTHIDDRIELRTEIFQEMWKYIETIPANRHRDSLSIEDLANLRFARELVKVLNVFESQFLNSYAIEAGKSLSHSIQEKHAAKLRGSIRTIFKLNTGEDRRLLASVMEPTMLQWARIPMMPEEMKQVQILREQHPAVLDLDEALALFDYLDPYSAHFIIVNGGARLKTYWGIDAIAEAGQVLSGPFNRALRKLQQNERFTDRSGIYYKGFNAQTLEYQHDRLMLDHLAEKKGVLILPHALSTTRFPEKSFARMDERTEDAEMVIHTASGIDVRLFHGQLGKGLGEVILLPEALQIRQREIEPRFQSGRESPGCKPLRYTAYSMKGDASAEPRWRHRSERQE